MTINDLECNVLNLLSFGDLQLAMRNIYLATQSGGNNTEGTKFLRTD